MSESRLGLTGLQDTEFMADIDTSLVVSMMDCISGASGIAIVTHTHPDGDALGSSLGLLRFLKAAGKDPVIVLNDRYPESLAFMTGSDRDSIIVYEEDREKAVSAILESGLIFCLDMNTFGRAENLEKALAGASCPKILIDHHIGPDRELFDIVFSCTGISSTCELLYYILLGTESVGHDAGKLPAGCPEALLTGMTTDTNNFANSVFPSTFRMASELLAAGTDRDAILSSLYNNYRENRFRLMGRLLGDKMKITGDGVAYMIIDRSLADEYDIREGETEGFVNIPLGMECVRMSILLKEEDDKFRVSIRSKKGTSANRCAAMFFNGGGHELAAGGKLVKGRDLKTGSAAEAAAYVEARTGEFLSM